MKNSTGTTSHKPVDPNGKTGRTLPFSTQNDADNRIATVKPLKRRGPITEGGSKPLPFLTRLILKVKSKETLTSEVERALASADRRMTKLFKAIETGGNARKVKSAMSDVKAVMKSMTDNIPSAQAAAELRGALILRALKPDHTAPDKLQSLHDALDTLLNDGEKDPLITSLALSVKAQCLVNALSEAQPLDKVMKEKDYAKQSEGLIALMDLSKIAQEIFNLMPENKTFNEADRSQGKEIAQPKLPDGDEELVPGIPLSMNALGKILKEAYEARRQRTEDAVSLAKSFESRSLRDIAMPDLLHVKKELDWLLTTHDVRASDKKLVARVDAAIQRRATTTSAT